MKGVRYLIPPRALCARGLYEAFYTQLREAKVHDLDNLMGRVLEKLTNDAIARTSTPPDIFRQKYRLTSAPKGKDIFDIDAMCFGEKRILMFECKKKALTNVARGGNTLIASNDFILGYLAPIIQTVRHEMQLRDPKGLTLLDGRHFALDGRHVRRFAVTMTDHGSMQDGTFLRNMVISLWGVSLTSADPAGNELADAINKKLLELVESVTALAETRGEDVNETLRDFAHNGAWYSVDQLFFFCGRTQDIQTAFGHLGSTTFGTGDVMNEYAIGDRNGILAAIQNPS